MATGELLAAAAIVLAVMVGAFALSQRQAGENVVPSATHVAARATAVVVRPKHTTTKPRAVKHAKTTKKPPARASHAKPAHPKAPVLLTTQTLTEGDSGPLVAKIQERLAALGYWVDTPYGTFDDSTLQAVWALQKAAGLNPDGVAGPKTELALAEGVEPKIKPAKGYLIEVNLADDILTFVRNDKIVNILNVSTGGGYAYYDKGGLNIAETPTGVFHTYTAINGMVTDSLGQLYRPRYFYSGFAIHGEGYVPPVPVSHGCVRVSDEAIDWIWAANMDPIGTTVWIYN